jgi:hypothetical protein
VYGPSYEPPPIEKVRKAQWTVENTRATQKVIDELGKLQQAVELLIGRQPAATIEAAIRRFKVLDPGVKFPAFYD